MTDESEHYGFEGPFRWNLCGDHRGLSYEEGNLLRGDFENWSSEVFLCVRPVRRGMGCSQDGVFALTTQMAVSGSDIFGWLAPDAVG